jgi:protein-S-isoprenylcysteine O-methyltransferase Ste14
MSVDPVILDAMLLTVVWLAYFAFHSLLASLQVKGWVSRQWPDFMPVYRLTFNFIAILLLAIPVWVMYTGDKTMVWQFTGWSWWLTNGLAILTIVGFMISLRYYDGQEFLGLRQLREREKRIEDQENLHISPFHRYVRHPWYSFALVLIWTRPMDSLMLVSAVFLSLYFFLGSRLEEEKLKSYYGDVYNNYIKRVPGLIPLPWKYLSKTEADELINEYQANQGR